MSKINNNYVKVIGDFGEEIKGIDTQLQTVAKAVISNLHNSEGIIQKIMDVCKTYTNHFSEIVYGNRYTAYDSVVQQVDGKWELDCSSFQNLLIHGVTFENSRYNGNSINKGNPLFFHGIDSTKYRLANQMAKYGVENGYAFYPNEDFSNIEAGDLVFYSWKGYDTNPENYTQAQIDFHNNAFMKIDHVTMYLGKKNDSTYQTIQYEQYTPQFFYDVNQNYMSQAVLVVRFPFANVENIQGNLVSKPNDIKQNTTGSANGVYKLKTKLEPGKIYTCCLNLNLTLPNTYIVLRTSTGTTLYSDYGRVWNDSNKDYKFHFICPQNVNIDEIHIGVGYSGEGTVTNRPCTTNYFYLYDGYKRDITKELVNTYPITTDITLTGEISGLLNSNMSPIYKVIEFDTYYHITINIPLTTEKNGNLVIGSIGKKMGNTCRIPCNLIGSDGVTSYNAILQISGTSATGDVIIMPISSTIQYKYVMASGIMFK